MIKARIAATILVSAFTCAPCLAADQAEDAAEAAQARIKAEARWVRAERDRANAILARDFVRGSDGLQNADTTAATEDHSAAAPEVSH
jgi:hypothetical protein